MTSDNVLEQFFSIGKKAIEYLIARHITTLSTDQMFNSQFILPFLTIFITTYVNPKFFKKIFETVKTMFKFNEPQNSYKKKENIKHIRSIADMKNYYDENISKFNISEYTKRILFFNPDFHTNLKLFLGDIPEISECMNLYDIKTKELKQNVNINCSLFNLFTSIVDKMDKKLFYGYLLPLYIHSNGNAIFFVIHQNETVYYIKNEDDFDELRDFIINKYTQVSSKLEINATNMLGIYQHGNNNSDEKADLYRNRNFDKIVSRYKNQILHALENFVKSNTYGDTVFNGFGTYNLGLIIYGKPGTGKTATIKAIATYLNRDVVLVDMRNIKTRKDFENLFKNRKLNKVVFVFEEFDCVMGVIKKRSNDSSVEEESAEISMERKDLLERKGILQLQKLSVEKDRFDEIDKQILEIDKQISNLNERMSLETMLTVLDGVIEHRNRVIIATTNHIDKIDPALTRAGRFDLKIELSPFIQEEIVELLQKMFKGHNDYHLIETTKFINDKFTPIDIINIAQKYCDLKKVINILSGCEV